jgi:hypothetical protein
MQAEVKSFWQWQQQFSDKKCCLQALVKLRWRDGFVCGCGKPTTCMNAPGAMTSLR